MVGTDGGRQVGRCVATEAGTDTVGHTPQQTRSLFAGQQRCCTVPPKPHLTVHPLLKVEGHMMSATHFKPWVLH
jgi:hypothetical protein